MRIGQEKQAQSWPGRRRGPNEALMGCGGLSVAPHKLWRYCAGRPRTAYSHVCCDEFILYTDRDNGITLLYMPIITESDSGHLAPFSFFTSDCQSNFGS